MKFQNFLGSLLIVVLLGILSCTSSKQITNRGIVYDDMYASAEDVPAAAYRSPRMGNVSQNPDYQQQNRQQGQNNNNSNYYDSTYGTQQMYRSYANQAYQGGYQNGIMAGSNNWWWNPMLSIGMGYGSMFNRFSITIGNPYYSPYNMHGYNNVWYNPYSYDRWNSFGYYDSFFGSSYYGYNAMNPYINPYLYYGGGYYGGFYSPVYYGVGSNYYQSTDPYTANNRNYGPRNNTSRNTYNDSFVNTSRNNSGRQSSNTSTGYTNNKPNGWGNNNTPNANNSDNNGGYARQRGNGNISPSDNTAMQPQRNNNNSNWGSNTPQRESNSNWGNHSGASWGNSSSGGGNSWGGSNSRSSGGNSGGGGSRGGGSRGPR